MAEALAILGAVGTSVALLDVARQSFNALVTMYDEYEHAGARMTEIQRHFDSICLKIEQWGIQWGFNEHNAPNDEVLTEFWGAHGWHLIEKQLAAVDNKCEALAAALSGLPVPGINYDGIPENDRKRAQERLEKRALAGKPHKNTTRLGIRRILKGNAREREVQKTQVLVEYISQTTTPKKKAKFVLSLRKPLQKDLEALRFDVTELEEVANKAWQKQHPETDTAISSFKLRWTIALTRIHEPALTNARRERNGSKALLNSCLDTNRALKLELNMLKNVTERFHLHVPKSHSDMHTEIFARCLGGSHALGPEDMGHCRQRLLDACELAETSGLSLFRVQAPAEPRGPGHRALSTTQHLLFSIRKSSELTDREQYKSMVRLSEMLENLEKAERYEIAHRIAESSLLLLRTSWLSALSSKTVMRLKSQDQGPRYILPIRDEFQAPIQRLAEGGYEFEPYIFNIGVFLAEIALQTPILDVKTSSEGLHLVFCESGQAKESSLRRTVGYIKDRMTVVYGEAVEFCLQEPVYAPYKDWERGVLNDSTCSEEEKSLALLDLYFKEVLIKLVMAHSEGSGVRASTGW